MLRVLVFNDAIPTPESPGIIWTRSTACAVSGQEGMLIVSDTADGVIDHDVFVISNDSLRDLRQGHNKNITMRLADRVSAGACLVCFLSDAELIGWLPVSAHDQSQLATRAVPAREIYAEGKYGTEPLAAALAADPQFNVQLFPHNFYFWDSLAWAKDRAVVAAKYRLGDGLVFLLPPMTHTREKVVQLILDRIIPKLLPKLDRAHGKKGSESPPDWTARVEVPGAAEMTAEISIMRTDIQRLRDAVDARDRQLGERLAYRDLLWMSGFELEDLVRDSLQLLGITAESKPPVDAVCDLGKGQQLYVEIEGSEGPTALKKGQQLLSYIADAPSPASVSGAIISNPYRKSPPDERPPEGAQGGIVVKQLESLAKKQGWPLITTTDLFGWVCRHLTGDKEAAREARRALGFPDEDRVDAGN